MNFFFFFGPNLLENHAEIFIGLHNVWNLLYKT